MRQHVCGWIALAAALAFAPLQAQSTGGGVAESETVVSVSFANGRFESNEIVYVGEEGTLGIKSVPAATWTDLWVPDRSSSAKTIRGSGDVTKAYDGTQSTTLASPIHVEYWAENGWSWTSGTDTRTFLRTYLDDSSGGASVYFSGIPFASYDVIVYFATDNGAKFSPVTINGTRYSWGMDGLIANAAADAIFGTAQQNTAELGRNAIRVNGLRGNLSIIGGTKQTVNGQTARGGIAAVQIVGHGEVVAAQQLRTLSVNFASGNGATYNVPNSETAGYGLEPVPGASWMNVTGASGTAVAIDKAYGFTLSEASKPKLSYTAALTWSYGTDATTPFLRGFLSDAERATTIAVTDIPFSTYDVIVYYGADNGSGAQFKPIAVNGRYYTWDAEAGAAVATDDAAACFGQTGEDTAAYGVNALRIQGLKGDLMIGRPMGGADGRTSVAALQIVCTGELIEDVAAVPSINVNFSQGFGTTIEVPDTDYPYGLVPVPGTQWVDLHYDTSRDQDVALADIAVANAWPKVPVVRFSAPSGWSYSNSNDADPFLKAFLGDGGEGAKVDVRDIPFTTYDVIVYCGADAGSGFNPITVNGTLYTWDAASGMAIATESANDTFGTASAQPLAVYGQSALRITGLTGDLSIAGWKRGSGANTGPRGTISAIQIVCTGEIVAPTPPSVMSLNFGSDEESVPQTEETYGLCPAPGSSWQNLPGANGTDVAVTSIWGEADISQTKVTYASSATWRYGISGQVAPFLRGYLDDGSDDETYQYGPSVSISGVPFAAYDVIVYYGTDSGNAYWPIRIGDQAYSYDLERLGTLAIPVANQTDPSLAFGQGFIGETTPTLGHNAIRVDGQTAATLRLQGGYTPKGDVLTDDQPRGGLAAVQIVERTLVTVSGEQSWVTLVAGVSAQDPVLIVFEAGASVTGDVTLPEDAIVDLSACAFDGEGAAVPFAGTLTVNEGTTFRLPEGFTSGKIATAVEGNYGQTLIAGRPVWLTLTDETGTFSASYLWTDQTGNHLWSEPGNWLSLLVPDASSAVVFESSAAHPEMVILDTAAVAGSVTIEGRGDDQGALTITSQDGGALTVSGRMLTTGNVAVTQSADITVNGKSVMVFPSGAPQTYPYPGAFHVEGENAAYTVAEGTLAVPAKPTSMANPTDVEATAGGYATVCRNATLTVGTESGATSACLSAFRVGMTWPSSDAESWKGTVRVLPTGIFEVAYQSSFASGVTLDLRGGTLRAKETATISSVGGYAPTSPVTLAAEAGATLTLSGALSGDAGITIVGPGGVRFVTGAITEAYTGEVTVSADAMVALGAGRPGLSVAEGARVNVAPTTGEGAIGRIVFPTTMESEPERAVFLVEGVTETVSAAVEDGTLVVSWPVAIPTLSTSASWSEGSWTDWEGEGAPTSGAAILDGTGAPIKVKLDTALSGMSTVVVRGDVTLATSTAQASIPTCVTLAEGATLTVSSGFAGAWTLPEGTTLRVTDAKVSLTGLTLEGVVELAFSDAEYETMAAFGGGLVVSGDNVRVSGIPYIGDAETRLEGDNVTLAFSGTSFYTHTVLVSAGEGNALENVQNLNGELRVTAGTLTVEVLDDEQNVAPTFLGAVIGAEATLRFTGVGNGGQFPVTGEGTLDLGTFRKQLAARSDGPLPKTLRLVATAAEQEAGVIAFPVYGDATLPEGFVAEVTPAEGGIAWVPVCAVEGSYLRIRNVPGTGIAGLPTEVETLIRERAQAEGWTSAYGVEVRTQGKTFGAASPEVAGLLEGALECFDVELGADIAVMENGEALTVFVAYEFGIEKVSMTEGGVVVTVRLDRATFKNGVSFTALNGETAIEGVSAAVAEDRASVTLTIPSVSLTDTLRLSVKVSPPTSAE